MRPSTDDDGKHFDLWQRMLARGNLNDENNDMAFRSHRQKL